MHKSRRFNSSAIQTARSHTPVHYNNNAMATLRPKEDRPPTDPKENLVHPSTVPINNGIKQIDPSFIEPFS